MNLSFKKLSVIILIVAASIFSGWFALVPPSVDGSGDIKSRSEIQTILMNESGVKSIPNLQSLQYEVIDHKSFERFLSWRSSFKFTYVLWRRDCKAFTAQMLGQIPFSNLSSTEADLTAFEAILRGETIGHRMVIVITDRGVFFVEPQTNKMWPIEPSNLVEIRD
jgi:hypothetical protein